MFRIFRCAILFFVSAWILSAGNARGDLSTNAAALAQNVYSAAKSSYEAHPSESDPAIKFAIACFKYADFATSNAQRVQIAREGIAAMRSLLAREPGNAAAHYYLAQNLGQVAQVKRMSALHIVGEMEYELLAARNLDEKLDHAGPDRCLGLIYQGAPGWPISIGSRKKARQHFLSAVELCPTYPDNRLCLIEASLKWGDHDFAVEQAAILRANWFLAKSQYSGPEWNSIWNDWQQRWDIIQASLGGISKKT